MNIHHKKTALLLSAIIASPVGQAELKGPWMPAYEAVKARPISRAAPQAVEKNKCYSNTKALRCSQLVQSLTKDTILKARLLASLSVSSLLLPDGTALGDEYNYGEATQDVNIYRITYKSIKTSGRGKGKPTILSGLVVIPNQRGIVSAKDGMVVYMHSTTADINNASGDRSEEAYGAITAFAGNDWVVAMPDYLGYGPNKEPHPYALGKLNAESGVSIIAATRELYKKLRIEPDAIGNQINVTGYSEGGGNALWLGRILDERYNCTGCNNSEMAPTRIAPMSGAYDLSGATAMSFVETQPNSSYASENTMDKPTLLAFAAVGTSKVANVQLDTLLKTELADQAVGLFPGIYPDTVVGGRMLTVGIDQLGYIEGFSPVPHPENLLQPELVQAIQTKDYTNPAMSVWLENDNLDWVPKVPVYLLGVIQDTIVPFASKTYPLPNPYVTQLNGQPAPYSGGNSESVMKAMRAQGLSNDQVAWMGFNGLIKDADDKYQSTMTHSTAFVPDTILAASFFRGGKSLNQLPQLADP